MISDFLIPFERSRFGIKPQETENAYIPDTQTATAASTPSHPGTTLD